jgi:PhnB protein
MAIQGARPTDGRVVPFLFVPDGKAALAFYQRAFGAKILYQAPMPGSPGIFAQFQIGEAVLQLGDETPERPDNRTLSPQSLKGTSVVLEMYVDDVDEAFRRAVEAGGDPTMPPFDSFFGDRYSWVTDPFGHIWALATVRETLTPDQIDERVQAMLAGAPEE